MEAEYVVCYSVIQEAVWLRRFLQCLEIIKTTSEPMMIYCDSMVVLAYAKDPKYHGKTKHIQIRYHFFQRHDHTKSSGSKTYSVKPGKI